MPPRNGNVRRTTRPAQPPSPAQASCTAPNDGLPPPRPTGRRNRRAPEVDNDITHLRKRNQGNTKTGARLIEYQDIPICSVSLEHAARPRACEWNQDGQFFVLTDETIFVMVSIGHGQLLEAHTADPSLPTGPCCRLPPQAQASSCLAHPS